MTQNRLQMNVEALTALSRCRSLPEFLAAHTALVAVDLTLENSQRLADLSMTVIKEATGKRCWPGEYACPSQGSSESHLKANAPSLVPGRLHIGRSGP